MGGPPAPQPCAAKQEGQSSKQGGAEKEMRLLWGSGHSQHHRNIYVDTYVVSWKYDGSFS